MKRVTRSRGTQGIGRSAAAGTDAWLIVAPGAPEERRVQLSRGAALRIGTDSASDVRLADPYVSGRHAEVCWTREGARLRDLRSRNGTFLEGVRVKEVVLQSGATLTVGHTPIRFETGSPSGAGVAPGVSGAEELLLAEGPRRFGSAIGSSPAMRRVFAMLARLAPTDLTVTLIGETGTGKDVLARSLHGSSPRSAGPFVVFDCGAVAPTLIESELFGHEKGAFTGAVAEHRGAFERAVGGTLFLDEVGELGLELQPKLLRGLEQRQIRRVGSSLDRTVDLRIVAATHRDLEEQVRQGRFRQDLFFRLSAAMVSIPPLRSRRDEIPELVAAFLAEMGRPMTPAQETLEVLQSYDWPGNVRELRNVVVSAAALADGPTLEPRHFLFFRRRRRDPTAGRLSLAGRSLESIERAAVQQTLRQFGGNKARAAQALGIAVSTLYEKIKKYL